MQNNYPKEYRETIRQHFNFNDKAKEIKTIIDNLIKEARNAS